MAGLISTGIAGFLTSAKFTGKQIENAVGKLVPECVSTFVSGFSGWMMTGKGDLECKSIYARDKIVTNEFVYNRIRVTEDEEIVTSNGKILAAVDNGDGTWTVYLDLREGDINPFADGDLLQGYYHSGKNSGVIYAVQRMTVQGDPDMEDQTMIVTCEEDSEPYKYMIIVRVGNVYNEERQAHIKISSRTNCMYFFDEITSWEDMDNPDKVKCVLGKADMGLIPGWAVAVVGTIKKWFGLIADGVILRGTFILQSSGKTIETELDGVGQTITEVETRFEIREGQISSKVEETKRYSEGAFGSADAAAGSAKDAAGSAAESEAAKVISVEKASEAKQTADGFTQTVTEKTEMVVNAANQAAGSANAAAGSAAASEAAKVISVEKASEAKQTADGFQSTVTETTKKAVNDAVAGADATIEEKVGTKVSQSAREWKVEVMGADADGNPNKILAAINADESGVSINSSKIALNGKVKVNGSFRSPFSLYTDKFTDATGEHSFDNVVPTSYGANTEMTLEWDISQNGRRRCIVNYGWDSQVSHGYVKITAPGDRYFCENGRQMKELIISREAVELMGFGDNERFYCWVVLNRALMVTDGHYGKLQRCLAEGVVSVSSSLVASLDYRPEKKGDVMSVVRESEGRYRINFPPEWGDFMDCYVMLTGVGNAIGSQGASPLKATLMTINPGHFIVCVSDDATVNDGWFYFQMFSRRDWHLFD